MQRLSGIDASFIYGETSSWHLHAGAVLVLDPSTAPEGFGVERIREHIRSRMRRLEPFRLRLVEVPLGLDRPLWVSDPDFDLESHVRAVGLPLPGGRRELGSLVGTLFAIKLDRTRPLWEVWYLEGLEHGHVALLVKVHHAAVDGIAGARLYRALLDDTPDAPREIGGLEPEAERVPSELELLARALLSIAGTPLRATRTAARFVRTGVDMIGFRRSESWGAATMPFQAPRTSLNQPITPHRDFAFCSVSLDDVKAVKRAFDVTVNDVVLAICAGALRRYLLDRGELPEQPLVAQVPVAVHEDVAPGETGRLVGNRVSVMGARLATHLEDPVERLCAIAESTRSAKAMHEVLGEDVILRLAEIAPPAVLSAGVRAYTRLRLAEHHPPIFNLIVSNVAGPQIPLYAAGARLVATYGIGPLLDGGGLNITVFSYCGSVDFGFVVCPEIVDDPWVLADAAVDALDELRRAARRRRKVVS